MTGSPIPRRDLLADAGIALAAFAASVALRAAIASNSDDIEGVTVATTLLLAASSLPLAARRLSPLGVFVATAVATSVLAAVAGVAGPPIGPTLALFWLAAGADGSHARTRLVIGVIAAMLALHAAASGIWRDAFPGTELLWGLLVWGGAWLTGDRARLRRERMAELEERARRAELDAERERRLAAAEERTRIARDLHDSAGHAINTILVHAGLGRMRAKDGADGTSEQFETIEQVARETVGEIDQLVGALRAAPGEEGEVGVEPPAGLAALDGLVERHRAAGMTVELEVSGLDRALPPAVDRGAYRILQEALTNAARHGAGRARVEVTVNGDSLRLTVLNPVRRSAGAAGGAGAEAGGHGLVGMRERVAILGGSFDAGVEGTRFEVHARLPLTENGA